ncbi:MAG: DUF2971 domain-containing protein [Rickettsiales bacterium]|nr:DUF2971 domain-containing protein [Rickettsiales bacterium]
MEEAVKRIFTEDLKEMLSQKRNVTLYKYMDLDAGMNAVESQVFRWSLQDQFHDPYEMQFDLLRKFDADQETKQFMREARTMVSNPYFEGGDMNPAIKSVIMSIKREQESNRQQLYATLESNIKAKYRKIEEVSRKVNHQVDAFSRQLGFFCASATKNNMQMWTHYADNHKGVVIQLRTQRHNGSYDFAVCQPVQYSNNMPEALNHELFKVAVAKPPNPRKVFEDLCFTKALEWSYEKEWRCLRRISRDKFEDVPYNPLAIDAIYFGCATPDHIRERFIKIIETRLPHVAVYVAARSSTQYGLTFECLKDWDDDKARAIKSEQEQQAAKQEAEAKLADEREAVLGEEEIDMEAMKEAIDSEWDAVGGMFGGNKG